MPTMTTLTATLCPGCGIPVEYTNQHWLPGLASGRWACALDGVARHPGVRQSIRERHVGVSKGQIVQWCGAMLMVAGVLGGVLHAAAGPLLQVAP